MSNHHSVGLTADEAREVFKCLKCLYEQLDELNEDNFCMGTAKHLLEEYDYLFVKDGD